MSDRTPRARLNRPPTHPHDEAAPPALRFRNGAREVLPIVFGYVPIGLAYGILGVTAGLPVWAILMMSVVVYAGSAQFIAVSLLSQGASVVSLVATTFLVNLRNLLYSSALSPRFERMNGLRLAWLAAEITDESFVMTARAADARGGRLPFGFVAGLNMTAQSAWVAGTALGAFSGPLVGDPARYGLDYALVAMFIGLLALQVHRKREVMIASVAGAASLLLHLLGAGMAGVVAATILAAIVGTYVSEPK